MSVARVAQSVEHTLGKGEVTGSIPVASSRRKHHSRCVAGRGYAPRGVQEGASASLARR